jgi:hypothetical protein
MKYEKRAGSDGEQSYVLPAKTLAGTRAECLTELDEVITELLYLRRHLLEDEADASRRGPGPPPR